jgi:glycosyltransferase involved in cell wall biosynthesis
MFGSLRVAVVIPAFNEELAIAEAVARVPDWVDRVIVVDDASQDDTARRAITAGGRTFEIVRHPHNRGVGAAIVSGYRRTVACGLDVAVVMAGDGQMDPADLPTLLEPIAAGRAEYVKGNRFARSEVWREMPATRIVGNVALSLATKVTSGYWSVFDSQCGYTAIHRDAIEAIELDRLFPRYGYPNDLLARLKAAGARVEQVPVRTIYGQAWKSGIKLRHVVYPISFVLMRSWARRVVARRSDKRLPAAPAR